MPKQLGDDRADAEATKGRANTAGEAVTDDTGDALLSSLCGVVDNRGRDATAAALARSRVDGLRADAAGNTADDCFLQDALQSLLAGADKFAQKSS